MLFLLFGWIYCQTSNDTISSSVLPPLTTLVPASLTSDINSVTTQVPVSITSIPATTMDVVITNTLGEIMTTRVIAQPTIIPVQPDSQQQDQGLSNGAKAGLIIGGVAVLAAAVGIYASI